MLNGPPYMPEPLPLPEPEPEPPEPPETPVDPPLDVVTMNPEPVALVWTPTAPVSALVTKKFWETLLPEVPVLVVDVDTPPVANAIAYV